MSNNFAEVIMNEVSSTIKEEKNPKNRLVKKIFFEPTEMGTVKMFVDSVAKDGWALDERKFLTETCQLVEERERLEFLAAVDHPLEPSYGTEAELLKRFGNQFVELKVAIDKLELLIKKDIRYFHEEEHPLLEYADKVACGLFITSTGQPDYGNIAEFRKFGFSVYPGDRDSFGWLTGCVQKTGSKHILVFG